MILDRLKISIDTDIFQSIFLVDFFSATKVRWSLIKNFTDFDKMIASEDERLFIFKPLPNLECYYCKRSAASNQIITRHNF